MGMGNLRYKMDRFHHATEARIPVHQLLGRATKSGQAQYDTLCHTHRTYDRARPYSIASLMSCRIPQTSSYSSSQSSSRRSPLTTVHASPGATLLVSVP